MDLLALDPVASAVYRVLLRRPETPPEELAAASGHDLDAVTAALAVLQARGLVDGLLPLRPDTVLEPALVDAEAGIAQTRRAVLAARRELVELVELYAGGVARTDRHVDVERVDGGTRAVQRRIDELIASLSGELLAVNPGYTAVEHMAEEAEQTAAFVARGLRLRTVVGPSVQSDPARLAHAHRLEALGDQHRVHPEPPLRMLLLDRRVVVVPLDPESPADGALFVWSAPLLRSFLALFTSLWEQARPLSAPVVEGLAPREAGLLELLAAGLKDETVARHLGVSVRTVRRESAALLDRLGAQTRFQAGVEAARRGWL